jgi:hypothetical protein
MVGGPQPNQTQYWCETHWEECHGGEDPPPPGPSDPDPSAPGYWLGTTVTTDACISPNGVGINDIDGDGLSDYCEKMLALTFAPERVYDPLDNIGGEPRLAARAVGDSVVLAYLFAYYMDFGSEVTAQCKLPWIIPFLGGALPCGGHNGDSEQIMLVVRYDPSTDHWVLKRARYFHHEGASDFPTDPAGYAANMEYPDGKLGGYPRVWISMRKHASYATQIGCNLGAFAGTDTCNGNTVYERISASPNQNIGSRAYHTSAQDSTITYNSLYAYYGGGRIETFWTDRPFRGWVPDSVGGGEASSYSTRLALMGF